VGLYLVISSALAVAIIAAVVWAKSARADDPGWRHAALARGFLLVAGMVYALLAYRATVTVFREVFRQWPR
jgi:hypothetical protein